VNVHFAKQRFLLTFLAPAFLLFSIFVAYPGIRALLYSLQKWDGLGDQEWIGLANFKTLLSDELFFAALRHNLILAFAGGTITLILALVFAALMHGRIRGASFFRVAFFFPNVIATVAVALIWLLLYSVTDFGMVNAFLGTLQSALATIGITIGKDILPFAFTDSKNLIWALVPMMVWTATGFYMVLFLASMEGIPQDYYEAAKLDGASPISQFWHITLPMIREVLVVGIVFLIISSMKFFDAIWVMESQYPTPDSHVLATVLYQKVFSEYNVGYGAAVAVMLFAIVFLATLLTMRLSRREALEY